MIALGTHLDNLFITAAESLLCKVLWVELYSLSIHMLKSEPLVPWNVTLFEDRVFCR